MDSLTLFGHEKLWTVKELSDLFKCDEDTILNSVRKYYPEIIKNGVKTLLNQVQITMIKKEIESHHNLRSTSELPKTLIEKQLLIKQAMQIQDEMIEELQKENKILKPKAIEFDNFMNADGYQTWNEVAKVIGIGRNIMLKILRDKGYLLDNNTPHSRCPQNYFRILETVKGNYKNLQTVVSSEGFIFIKKIVEKYKEL